MFIWIWMKRETSVWFEIITQIFRIHCVKVNARVEGGIKSNPQIGIALCIKGLRLDGGSRSTTILVALSNSLSFALSWIFIRGRQLATFLYYDGWFTERGVKRMRPTSSFRYRTDEGTVIYHIFTSAAIYPTTVQSKVFRFDLYSIQFLPRKKPRSQFRIINSSYNRHNVEKDNPVVLDRSHRYLNASRRLRSSQSARGERVPQP